MKRRLRSLFQAVALCSSGFWLTGCEAEAEEDGASSNVPTVTNVLSTNVTATNLAVSLQATNTATTATNEQVVILNKIEPTIPPNLKLTRGVEEIIKLAQSGVSETVLLLFVEKANHPFDLDAAEIVYLNDIGVPQTVIAAMLNHDGSPVDVNTVIETNRVEIVTAPPHALAAPAPDVAQAATAVPPIQQPVEVSSNYVADPNYQAPAVQQQPAIVQQQPVVVQQPVIVEPAVNYSYFYSSLSPYGSWVEVADYGWCWRPTIAVTHRGWRPYAHGGRWYNSDAGWYWHSDYSWGWAPFHYGRWHCAPSYGWIWTPDYNWGPSWVTWRYSGGHCGWAPLPPHSYVRPGVGFSYWGHDVGFSFNFGLSHEHYTFVPTRHFHQRRIAEHVVPTERTSNIYKESTVVNNYIVGNNNTIINNGIGRDKIESHTRTEIPRVRVQDAPANSSVAAVQPDRLHRRGAETVVYRPSAPPAAANGIADAQSSGRSRFGNNSGPAAVQQSRSEPRRQEASAATGAPGAVDTARPQMSSRASVPPVLAKPEPIRPEPQPNFTPRVQSSRAVQEARRNENSGPATGNVGTVAPAVNSRFGNRPIAPVGTPGSGGVSRNEAGRNGNVSSGLSGQPAMPPSISGQSVGTPSPRSEQFGRSELSRQAQPSAAPQAPAITGQARTRIENAPDNSASRFGAQPAMPPSISGQAAPGNASSTPAAQSSTPVTTGRFGASRFGSTAPAAPPSTSGQAVPGAPTTIRRSETRYEGGTVTRQSESSRFQSAPAVNVPQQSRAETAVPSGTGSRFGNSPRSESFARPANPVVQRTPAPVMQPRTVTPVAPSRVPTYVPPPAPSGISRSASPNVNSGSSGGSRFGSAPQSAPAPVQVQRPSAPPQQGGQSSGGSSERRGRVEIGR